MSWTLLTGVAGGIGAAIAQKLTSGQDRVVGLDIMPPPRYGLLEFVHCDLIAADMVWLLGLLDKYGAPRAAIFAHGVYDRTPIHRYCDREVRRVMAINFESVFRITSGLVEPMAAAGGGNFVFLGSQAGAFGGADPIYAASKAACVALSKSLARELGGRGIRANVVSPGPVRTPMAAAAMTAERQAYYAAQIPIGRFTEANEVAEVACFLATQEGSSINGATIDIDGGLFRRRLDAGWSMSPMNRRYPTALACSGSVYFEWPRTRISLRYRWLIPVNPRMAAWCG